MKTKVIEYIYRIQDGGAETLIKDYALLLDKDLFDVTVMCCDIRKDSANYQILKENNIRVIALYEPCTFINKVIAKIIGKKHPARLLKKAIEKEKPDTIHIHLESLETFSYCSEELKGINLLYTCHNVPKTMIGSDLPKENKAAKLLIQENNLKIIALYKDMAEDINNILGINNTLLINNGINFKEFLKTNKTKEEIRNELNIPQNAYVIGHTGRFTYQKNHEKIIEIFNEVYKTNKDAFLLLIGTGNLLNEIKEKINSIGLGDRAMILSNRNDVSDLLLAMDVFLFPSRYEGVSIALIEAQARDLPCIVSNKVNKETYFSNKITELDISEDNRKWADYCLKPKCNIGVINKKEDFDLTQEIKRLEKYYLA